MTVSRRALAAALAALLALAAPQSISRQAPAAPAEGAAPAAEAPAKPRTHRPLRENVEFVMPEPTEPQVFKGYPDAPPYAVVPRTDKFIIYPCTTCHKALVPNPKPRKLATPHPAALTHGSGRMWCTDCHTLKNRDVLHTLRGEPVDFNQSHLVCGQCHANRHKDWVFGAHGKRVDNWQGERVLYNCTHCHNPHDPVVQPREPSPPPPVRAGLAPMQRTPHGTPPVWARPAATEPKR